MSSWLPANPEHRKRIQHVFLFAAVLVGVMVFTPAQYSSGLLGINDLRKEQMKLHKQVSALEAELVQCNQVLAREESLIRERGELAPLIEHYQSRLPSTIEMPELLRELDTIANRSGQIFSKHERLPPVDSGPITELPYRIELHSDYHGFGAFLNAIENAARFAKVDDIQINFDKSDFVRHRIALTLSTFKFNEDKLLAANAAPAQPTPKPGAKPKAN